MTAGRTPDHKTMKNSKNCVQKTGSIGVRKSSKGTNRSIHKTHGCGVNLLDEKENHCSGGMDLKISAKDIFHMEKRKALELHPDGENISTGKMKLQLFPINKVTQIGLEKGGHNPYLELTLGGQKKISSVLKHLKKKWGSSMIAIGEPMLFPYNIKENLSSSRRWTLDDSEITTAAVHAAVGSPAIFRLRYGWFSTNDPRSMAELSVSFSLEAGLQSKGKQGGGITNSQTLNDDHNEANTEYRATDVGDATNAVGAQKMDTVPGSSLDNEPISSVAEQPSLLWVDGLSNISIGGLLSEASLQGKLSSLDSKLNVSNTGMQPSQKISDLLGASNISIGGLLSEASLQGKLSALDSKLNGSNAGMQPSQIISDLLGASNISIGGLLSEASLQGKLSALDSKLNGNNAGMQPSQIISDLLGASNISIGGFLSEASLQGKSSALDSKLNVSNASMQPSQIISDSLDAFIISQNSHPKVSTEDLRPSILDAEETCHAFPLRKFSSGTRVQSSTGKTLSGPSSLDISNSFKVPEAEKVNNKEDGLPQDCVSGRNETDLLLSRTRDEERSIGFGSINWCDSLGPFDLGMPAQKFTGGDSVSIGGFVR